MPTYSVAQWVYVERHYGRDVVNDMLECKLPIRGSEAGPEG